LDLYRRYGDWYLAMAAYNCGAGCVDRAILRTGYSDFWELRRLKALPLATTNYVPEVLAMTIMYKNAKAYGIQVEPDPGLEYDNVVMESDTNLDLVAAAIDRPVGQVKQMNPALLQTVAPRGYYLHLPPGEATILEQALKVLPAGQRKTGRIHRFSEADTLLSVAKKYGTTVAKLLDLNPHLDQDQAPEPGVFAAIPGKAAAAPAKAPAKKASTTKKAAAPKKTAASKEAAPKKTAAKKPAAKSTPSASAKSKKSTRG
jgi:membrane-bound lytic murein transglycosylase D